MTVIAYLAPEIPALSATFVYEELLAIEARGIRVVPVSVRAPGTPATDQDALAQRTKVLYDGMPTVQMVRGALAVLGFGHRSLVALRLLMHDVVTVGAGRFTSWKLLYQWLVAARLGRLLQREGCSHLHVHFAHVPSQIAMYASAFTGIPFTITAHANDIFERGALLVEKAARAKKLLTISHYNVNYLRSLGIPEHQLAVVRCGVRAPSRTVTRRREYSTPYRLGSLGRLVEKKGMDDVLRALALLPAGAQGVELTIAGDGPARRALEELARECRVGDRVRFEGALSHGDVTDWMQSLDAFVLACKPDRRGDMDGIPVALMEAMSQGVPVISTRLSGIPELVVDEATGLLVPPADPPALAAAMERLMNDQALGVRLTEAAARHVEAEFGQDVNLDRLMGFLPAPRGP